MRRSSRRNTATRREFDANERKAILICAIAHVPLAVANRCWHFRFVCSLLQINTKNMPFEQSLSAEASLSADDDPTETAAVAGSRQLALRLSDMPAIALAPMEPRGRVSLQDVQCHITYLNGQLETLRRQLRDHPADRLAMLLREMIQERERELERWLAQEQRWDERLAAIESAITERDQFRERQAELIRERDEARREAEAAAARLDAAQRGAEAARRHAAALERTTEKAQAEQLRLRHEREIDKSAWQSERRRLEAAPDKGWLARFLRS
jgi:hypothetical protein